MEGDFCEQSPKASWQRRMGVEPTEDAAEAPPNGFEDRDSHRTTNASPYAAG